MYVFHITGNWDSTDGLLGRINFEHDGETWEENDIGNRHNYIGYLIIN